MPWPSGNDGGFPPAVRAAILRRDPTCQLRRPGCTGRSTEADHVVPRSRGGSDDVDNGRGVCGSCHQAVTQEQAAAGRREVAAKRLHPAARRPHPGLRG